MARCPYCREEVADLDEHLKKSFAVDVRKQVEKEEESPEADCNCGGGEQGDGLCYVPHEKTCPVYERQRSR